MGAGGSDPKGKIPLTVLTANKFIVDYSQSFFFLFVFVIDCHILKIFSVITTWVKERYVLWFRKGGIAFIVGCVLIVVAVPSQGSANLASAMGALVFLFDNILSIYLVIALIRLKKLNIEMGSVTDAVSFLICIILVVRQKFLICRIGSQ